jgi:hypothetical protein
VPEVDGAGVGLCGAGAGATEPDGSEVVGLVGAELWLVDEPDEAGAEPAPPVEMREADGAVVVGVVAGAGVLATGGEAAAAAGFGATVNAGGG